MYNFDGEYRRTKEQNLAGASKLASGKDELISRAHKERMKRQMERKRETSAVRIQKVIRGFLCRLRLKKKFNLEFGECLQLCKHRQTMPSDVQYLIARLHFISHAGICKQHLEDVTRKALSISNDIIKLAAKDSSWIWRLNILLTYCLKIIHLNPANLPLEESVLLMCNALETFTALNDNATPITIKKILLYLLHQNYMMVLKEFLLRLHNQNGIQFPADPLKYSEVRFSMRMLSRPITLLDENDDAQYRNQVIICLCRMLASENGMSEPVRDVILPAIMSNCHFRLKDTLQIFLTFEEDMHVPAMLYFFLALDQDQRAIPKDAQSTYFDVLAILTKNLTKMIPPRGPSETHSDIVAEFNASLNSSLLRLLNECLNLLNTPTRSEIWMEIIEEAISRRDYLTMISHSTCVLHILLCDPNNSYKYRIINDLWSAEGWLRGLWVALESQCRQQIFEEPTSVLSLVKRGTMLTKEEAANLLPVLTTFSSFLFSSLSFLTDEDLMKPEIIMTKAIKPFTVNEIVYIACTLKDVAVGLIVLGFPDALTLPSQWVHLHTPTNDQKYNSLIWTQALTECIKVVREVYQRNERCQMVNESDWHSFLLPVPDNGLHCFTDLQDNVRIYPPFTNYRTDLLDASSTHTIGSWCDRACTLLTSLPFTIPFNKRCRMLWNVLSSELHGYQNPDMHFLQIPHISTTIRRGYIYEDSFEKFSIDSAPELKIAIRIRFTNALNMEEAGIDGGGIFREFITDLLKTAFDPNRGFFILTKDNKLYPNPNVATVYPNFTSHYFFIGRMLAKAIFENIIVDIPLAEFFLSKIIDTASLYPSMLYTLDKDLFKNISYIRTSIDDYSTLGLDFTTTTSSFGSSTVVELKKNGADIPVNKDNVIEYLHLISKQKLHSDISKQTRAFTKGLGNVLPLHMVRMFTPREIQLIISGDHSPIDLSDLQKNVIYTGGFSSSHETIKMFWNVLDSFTDLERRQMLKFVTSCTRPPLRGFKDLHPPFCIQLAEGMDNRLPTASTCMNILKLPIYTDEATMKEKLLYAIQSGAGFELS
ncbi:ubiquitin-protein ligase E3C [Rhodnius prolixus]